MIIRVLSLLLIAQLALTAIVYWPGDNAAPARSAMLTAIDRTVIDAITISDSDDNAITLTREGSGWRMPSDLPADDAKVTALLDTLLTSDPGFAIARSDSAAKRFELADDNFERKIELLFADGKGDDTATLYLGSSPAFRKVHARLEGENAVYVLDFNSYDAPATDLGWLDRELLALRNLERITLGDQVFELSNGRWLTMSGEPVDAQAMDALLNGLAALQVSGISDMDNETTAAAIEILRIEGSDGNSSRTVSLLENSDAELYYLSGDKFTPRFNTSSYDAERLLDAVEQLTTAPVPEGAVDTEHPGMD
jgi:hypothetical protein